VGASNNVTLRLCDPVDQPSANVCANLCPAHLKSDRIFFHILLITAQRCDDTVDKKRVNSCLLKHLFLERVGRPKISSKRPGNALSDALLMSCFQNFAADDAKKITAFETALRAVSINE